MQPDTFSLTYEWVGICHGRKLSGAVQTGFAISDHVRCTIAHIRTARWASVV